MILCCIILYLAVAIVTSQIAILFTGPQTGRLKRVEPKGSLFANLMGVLTRK